MSLITVASNDRPQMPHPFGEDHEQRGRILTFLGEQTLPRIVQLTMPLFVPDDRGLPQLVGSGVVLEVGPARLLLTATHVVTRWPGLSINVGVELLQVRGELSTIHTRNADAGSVLDKLDVSVIRLDGELPTRIPAANVAGASDLDFTVPVVGRDPFLLSGYPVRRNRDGLNHDEFTARAYSLLMHDGQDEMYLAVGAQSDSQLVLPFERNDVWTVEKRVTAPDLEGISGGGLWRVPINDEPLGSTRLAAIAVEQHPKGRHRHVLATRVRPILSALHDVHEDLRQPLEDALRDAVA